MHTLNLTIQDAVTEQYPGLVVGGFLAAEIGTASKSLGDTPAMMESARAALEEQGIDLDSLSRDPRILGWREAVAPFAKPSRFKCSAEQLARRLLKDGSIPLPLPVVAAYCAISVKLLAPLGCYDLHRLPGSQIELRKGRPGLDSFEPLGSRSEEMPVTEKTVVYACGDEILCWGFNCRDSARVCLKSDTSLAAFFAEAVSPAHDGPMRAALPALAGLLQNHGAKVGEIVYACKVTPSAVFAL